MVSLTLEKREFARLEKLIEESHVGLAITDFACQALKSYAECSESTLGTR